MMKRNRNLNQYLEAQVVESFCQVLAEETDAQKIRELLSDLTSPKDFIALCKRLAIAVYLDKGRSYENISDNLAVDASTILMVAERLDRAGVQRAIEAVKAERWANYWSRRLTNMVKWILPR